SVTATNVALTANGAPVDVSSIALSDGDRRIRVTSKAALAPSTVHTLTLNGLRDVTGNGLAGPIVSSFTTGDTADLSRPTIVSFSPFFNAGPSPCAGGAPVPRTMQLKVKWNEALDPITVSTSTTNFRNQSTGQFLPYAIALDSTNTLLTITPSVLLPPDT